MSVSTIVNITLSVLSALLAILSIIFVIITLRQNKKMLEQNNRMIENATRPYITIYLDSITICEPILNSLKCGNKNGNHLLNNQYAFVKGITLAPGQSKMLLCNVPNIPKEVLTFKIGYTSSEKYYEECIELNVKNYSHIPVPRPDTCIPKGNERQVHSLREIIERLI